MTRFISPSKPRLRDNLIPLRGGGGGHQLAGWQPAAAAMTGLGCQILANQRIPVGEGIELAAEVYLPKVDGKYPAIVVFGAYTKELHAGGIPAGTNEVGCPPVFTDRGYAHVVATRRGMGQSGGGQEVFCNDQDVADHESVIAWAAAQPWCNGEVVMYGTSYYGMVQPLVAVRRPPALKAFFTNEMCTDYFRHIVMYGGTPNNFFLSLWMGSNFTPAVIKLRLAPIVRGLASQVLNSPLKRVWAPMFRRRVEGIMAGFMKKTPIEAARRWYVNWLIDGKTRATSLMPKGPSGQLDRIEIPFVVAQNEGMWNLHQFGSFDLWQNAGTPCDRKWLIIGQAIYDLPTYDWQQEAMAFFDFILRGTPNGYDRQAPVRYWLDGADHYRQAQDFPVPGASVQRLYLASEGADDVVHALRDRAPDSGSNRWAAVPLHAQTVGGFDELINQVLSYDFQAQDEIEFAGPVTANLSFSCNEIDSHVVARVSRIDRNGNATLLSMGMLRPARRRIDAAASTACEVVIDTDITDPLTPDVPVTLRFSLTPAPVRLRRGERLRLDIASRTDLLRSDVSHNHAHFDAQVPPYFSRNTVHYGPDSYLELHRIQRP